MKAPTWWGNFYDWLTFVPVRIAYRIIWAAAITGNETAVAVYKSMWRAQLDLPVIPDLID